MTNTVIQKIDNIKIDLNKEKKIAVTPGDLLTDIFKGMEEFIIAVEIKSEKINTINRQALQKRLNIQNIHLVQFLGNNELNENKMIVLYNTGKRKEMLIEKRK